MATLLAISHPRRPWGRAIASILVLVLFGAAGGLVSGLALVHALALLGLHLDTGTGQILHQALSW